PDPVTDYADACIPLGRANLPAICRDGGRNWLGCCGEQTREARSVKTLIIIPTYNEIDSLPRQVDGVRAADPSVDILVVDDNSPDGTGEWADARAAADAQVHVMHRPGKEGLGAAYRAGFAWALERGYERIVEMDADGSHRAEDLPLLLADGGEHDLVIGSRW